MILKWVTLHVRDFEASKRFYIDYLGLPLRQSFSPRPGMSIAFLGQEDETQLELFATERSRVKECAGRGTWWYWLRSPSGSTSTYFCRVRSSGNANSYGASYSYGVAFGFYL